MEHWRNWKPIDQLTAAELHVLATNYRVMAATASSESVAHMLLRLSDQYKAIREVREAGAS
jgi:hypothetical protein